MAANDNNLYLDAIEAANPEIEGDLMHHLTLRGVDGQVRAMVQGLSTQRSAARSSHPSNAPRQRRSRYVHGWRPEE